MNIDKPQTITARNAEIVTQFNQLLDSHLSDFMAGRVHQMFELQELADAMCLHPVHLSKVIKQETGKHACYWYEQRILTEAKALLANQALMIKDVAHRLDYDVSNFTKFFKRFTGITPSVYRRQLVGN